MLECSILLFFMMFVVMNVLISMAFMTQIESKLMSATQNRKGPNVVGSFGLLQPFADALKLIMKESIFPSNSKFFVFILSPFMSLFFALISWGFVPFNDVSILVDSNLALFFMFACSILHIYGVILAGWSSGSKYSFLGAVSSTAQLVSYDISFGLIISCMVFYTQSLNLMSMVELQKSVGWLCFYLPLLFVVFFISSLAETNSHPFDLPEAESELVGGYTTEYSSSYFALFFLGEYCSILIMVFLMNHLFLGGWTVWFKVGIVLQYMLYLLKILMIYYCFVMVSTAMPSYSYDQLMRIGWKFVMPICLSFFFVMLLCFFMAKETYSFLHLLDLFVELYLKAMLFFFLPGMSFIMFSIEGSFADLIYVSASVALEFYSLYIPKVYISEIWFY